MLKDEENLEPAKCGFHEGRQIMHLDKQRILKDLFCFLLYLLVYDFPLYFLQVKKNCNIKAYKLFTDIYATIDQGSLYCIDAVTA